MHLPRIYENLGDFLKPNKALIIYGPRQVGKTTLVKQFLSKVTEPYKFDSGDNIHTRNLLSNQDFDKIFEYVEGYPLIVIDEAQKIQNIGESLKIMIDHVPGIKVIVTGSSSFELAGQVGEPLTGRKRTLTLYPMSHIELTNLYNLSELKHDLEKYLIFGKYPEVVAEPNLQEKREIVAEIAHSYLLKDILELEKIKNPKTLFNLLRLLAFQIGSEVSLTELAQKLAIDYKTVDRYLSLLEKTFVIYILGGFSRNLRNEITKKNKYYFYDLGIRNALISNFNKLELRNDVGMLWENFLISERLKKQSYKRLYANNYFWRTWEQKEIDWIEEREGKLFAYEFKWNTKPIKPPKLWLETYKDATFEVVNNENYLDFII